MVTIIKGNFKGEKKESAKGAFLLVFNETDNILSSEVLITNDVTVELPTAADRYEKFNQALKSFANNYLINSTLTLPLREKIKDRFDKETVKKIKQLPKEELNGIINRWIGEVVKERITMEIEKEELPEKEYEKLTRKEVTKLKEVISRVPTPIPAAEKEEYKEEYEEIDIYLKTQLAVDEKRGKQVTELLKGDKILVRITDERRSGEYLARLLGGRKNSNLIPIVADAEAAKEENNKYRIIVKFGPGIFGEALIPKETKIKVLTDQEVEEILKEREEKRAPLFSGFALTPIVLVEVIIFILLLALAGWWGIVK